jgi:NADPH2:quinone reductase
VAEAAPADHDLVRGFGADVIQARGPGLGGRLRDAVPDGVHGLIDAALIGATLLAAVRDGGGMAVVRGSGESGSAGAFASARRVSVNAVNVHDYEGERDKLDRLGRQAEAGVLSLRVARTLPAAQAGEAHRLLAAGGLRGRLVLRF